jgi:hypothetical protein
VLLNWEAAYARAYRIEVSTNGSTWSPVFTETNGNGGIDDITFTAVDARYVRMYGTQRGTQWGYSLWEFEVYGAVTTPVLTSVTATPASATVVNGNTQSFSATAYDQFGAVIAEPVTWSVAGGGSIDPNTGLFSATTVGGPFTVTATGTSDPSISGTASVTVTSGSPAPPGNLAQGQPAVALSQEGAAFAPLYAVDGNTATRWASTGGVDPQWIYVDLGAVYPVDHVLLNWEAAYARAYRIEVSTNGSTWSPVFTETNGNGGIDDITFTAVDARYVRMYGTQRGTKWGYSLWEFEVYGATP